MRWLPVARNEQRKFFTEETRLALLEGDVDSIETTHHSDWVELKDEIKGLSRVMIGLLISLATASVLLALNLVVLGNK